MKPSLLFKVLIIAMFLCSLQSRGQNYTQVTSYTSATYGSENVTQSTINIDYNFTLCGSEGPFFAWNGGGGFSYTFSHPVASIKVPLIFAGYGYPQNIHFTVNGSNYTLTSANLKGNVGICSDGTLAVLASGDLNNLTDTTGFPSQTVVIPGPITSFSIVNTNGPNNAATSYAVYFQTPSFDNGSTQSMTVCQNSAATSINSNLTASGGTGTYTWMVVTGPSHGTLSGLSASASAGTSVSPASATYMPTSGYSGPDSYVIQVSDGTNTANATINVNVSAIPTPSFSAAPGANSCVANSILYTTQSGMSSYAWSIPGTAGTNYNITSGSTTTNSVGITWLNTGSKTVTVNYTTSSGCTGVTVASNTTSVNTLPVPTFTTSPGANVCASAATTYTTQSGMSSYSWSIPGTSGTDYNITAGGTGTNSVGITWLTAGSKTVTVNYTTSNGCTGATVASNTTSVNALPVPTFTSPVATHSCTGGNVIYATQSGMSGYTWTIPGVSGTDYTITGGSTSSNTITLGWMTAGTKAVTVNYTNASLCTGAAAAANTTTVNPLPVPSFTATPTASICASTNGTYSTQSGMTGYNWTIPGVPGTD